MKQKQNQGFSLVELILAVAILGIIMVAIASFMTTTTKTYKRTKNDTEMQQTGQELFDMITDKIMQANEIRVGTVKETVDGDGNIVKSDQKEFAILGTNLSAKVDPTTGQLLKENGTPANTSGAGYAMYSFDELDEDDTRVVEYIAVFYEGYNEFAGSKGYGPIVDTYYFDSESGAVYMYRHSGGVRGSSQNSNPDGSPKTRVPSNPDSLRMQKDSMINTSINPIASLTDLDDHIVCENVSTIHGYAIPKENALFLQIEMEKGGMENLSKGMVTIRNSYVLEQKPEKGEEASPDPDDE